MLVVRDGETSKVSERRSCIAIGVFDGLHRGHQRVIELLIEFTRARGKNEIATVVTFDPHPAQILAPDHAPRLIGTLEQRLEGLDALGVEQVRVLTFSDDLAQLTPEEFVAGALVDELHVGAVLIGRDFRFGHNRIGDVAILGDIGATRGFDVEAVPSFGAPHPGSTFGTPRWSSTAVRSALGFGEVDAANEMLGRPFVLRGVVEHGDARGGELGFPTANVLGGEHQLIPELGIYAGAARTRDHEWRAAAISVGTRPQFYEDGPMLVEVHLPGFRGNLYDQALDVAFLTRLRGERKFDGVAELVDQIARDVAETTVIFEKFSPLDSLLLR